MFYQLKTATITRNNWARILCLTLLFATAHFTSSSSIANDTTQRLRTSVARMNQWLGGGSDARAWRQILALNVLDSQTARGEQADLPTLRSILNRLDQQNASLRHPMFIEVRGALSNHIQQLERIQSQHLVDLQFAASQAISQFQKPTAVNLDSERNLARYELEIFRQSYRSNVDIQTRTSVFNELKLDEMIAFIKELKIEMPPEVSVGKMNSMIADERKRLEEVTDKIDAMPLESPEEDDDDEDPDNLDIDVAPPGPDTEDEEDLKTLESRREAIIKRIRELQKKGREIAKQDRPRRILRRDNGAELLRIKRRFRVLARERTDSAFYAAKQAVDSFADAYIFGTEDNIQQEYLDQISELVNLLPDLNDPNARLSHAKVGGILHWLESRQQLNDLCVAIRRRYSNPNAYVSVSSRIIQGLTVRSSSEPGCIAEDFLGRFARGSSLTTTNVNLVPVNNPNQVQVSILLSGTASTDTYIRERSFRIDSTASGCLSARRDLYGNLNGLFATAASANANMSTQYGGISSSCRLIQRIAKKSFQKEQGKANAESTRRAKQRLQDRFVSETSSLIDQAVGQVESFSTKSREFSSLLPQLYLRSFSQRVEAVAKKDTRFAMGSTSQPTFQVAGSDIQLKLHESMISNYLDLIFAGRKFTKADFEKELEAFGGLNIPAAENEDGEEIEDFEITFPKVRPVQVVFAHNRLGIRVTGNRFEQGENSIKTKVVIAISLKIVNRGGKLFLEPAEAPQVNFAEDEEPDAESIAFVKILEERLGDALANSDGASFELPPNLIPPLPQLEGNALPQSLHLGLLELRDGWLYLGWNWKGGVVNTPAIWNEVIVEEIPPLYIQDNELTPGETVEGESVLIIEPELGLENSANAVEVPTVLGQ